MFAVGHFDARINASAAASRVNSVIGECAESLLSLRDSQPEEEDSEAV